MNQVLAQMLSKYEINNRDDRINAIKEIVQEIVLCGLSRSDFFEKAAFYGGTALRIFYDLDRFSEDLDFSLLTKDSSFNMSDYFSYIENEIKSLGLNFSINEKLKNANSNIKSAFLKGNTIEHIMIIYEESEDVKFLNKEEVIRIKIEVDVNPSYNATYETQISLLPSPYQIRVFDKESLFAGKIHACLCRNWKSRVKGRDFYDFVFFLSMNIKVNLSYLKAKLVESNFIAENYDLSIENLKLLLKERFKSIDFEEAKNDVLPFIKDKSKIALWSKEFFISICDKLKAN